jgi:hypothetical protein
MMEAGVDILRITRVLRAQTDNPRLLDAYNKLDHDLRMGQGLADAMEQVPEMFSPFAVSLVRQGEARNDIAGAFYRIADFLQKEDEVAVTHQGQLAAATGQNSAQSTFVPDASRYPAAPPSAILPVWVVDDLVNRVQMTALRIFTVVSGLLLSLAAVWASVELGWVEKRWQNVVVCSVAALFIGGSGVWLRRRMDADRRKELERRRVMEEQAAKAFDDQVQARSAGEKIAVDAVSGATPSANVANQVKANSQSLRQPPTNGGPPAGREATFE